MVAAVATVAVATVAAVAMDVVDAADAVDGEEAAAYLGVAAAGGAKASSFGQMIRAGSVAGLTRIDPATF